MRRLYFEGETTCHTPSRPRLMCRMELPTASCSSWIWSGSFAVPSGLYPCWKKGSGYSWFTNSSPSWLPFSGKYAMKSLL